MKLLNYLRNTGADMIPEGKNKPKIPLSKDMKLQINQQIMNSIKNTKFILDIRKLIQET